MRDPDIESSAPRRVGRRATIALLLAWSLAVALPGTIDAKDVSTDPAASPEVAEPQVPTPSAAAETSAESAPGQSTEGPEEVSPPQAPKPPAPPSFKRDSQVAVGGSVHVERGEITQDVVAVGGSLTVDGEVRGDAVAVGGSASIDGPVSGEVVSIGGSVHLGPHADVRGDVTSVGGRVERTEGARVGGQVNEVGFGPILRIGGISALGHHGWTNHGWSHVRPFARFVELFVWFICLTVTVLLACLAWLLAQRPLERIEERVALEPWKAGLVGLLSQIFFIPLLVLVVIVLVVSIIGIPLLLLVPFAVLGLLLAGFLGYTAVAHHVGRWGERRFGWHLGSSYVAIVVGFALILACSLVGHLMGVVPGPLRWIGFVFVAVGALVRYLAVTVGFGAAVLTRFGTEGGWRRRAAPAPPAPRGPEGSDGGHATESEATSAEEGAEPLPAAELPPHEPAEAEPAGWEPEPEDPDRRES